MVRCSKCGAIVPAHQKPAKKDEKFEYYKCKFCREEIRVPKSQ